MRVSVDQINTFSLSARLVLMLGEELFLVSVVLH